MKVNPDQSNVIHFNMRKQMPVIDYGEGIYLFDKEGKRLLEEK